MSNYISASISEENKVKALGLIAELRTILGFGITLTKEQKEVLLRVEDGRIPFVEKAIEYGKQEPKIVPPFTDLDEYTKDLTLFKALSGIARELSSLNEIVTDTRMAAGSDAFSEALRIYKISKEAAKAGVPGTKSMVDELSKLFQGQGKNKKNKDKE